MTALQILERDARIVTAKRSARPQLIRQAREEGATWEQISEALSMSRAGVIKLAGQQNGDARTARKPGPETSRR